MQNQYVTCSSFVATCPLACSDDDSHIFCIQIEIGGLALAPVTFS